MQMLRYFPAHVVPLRDGFVTDAGLCELMAFDFSDRHLVDTWITAPHFNRHCFTQTVLTDMNAHHDKVAFQAFGLDDGVV